ncbi:MAG: cytochrome c3 family protein [Planctomycetes bacterium]|nr:cytochrome c3 family protein [Planctomycetota bacterium]
MSDAILAMILTAVLSAQDREKDKACIECHEKQGKEHAGSVHDAKNVTCTSCHGNDEVNLRQKGNPHRKLKSFRGRPKEIVKFCGDCHQSSADFFQSGPHREKLRREVQGRARPAEHCIVCHDNHRTETLAFASVRALCLECHPGGDAAHDSIAKFENALNRASESMAALDDELARFPKRPGLSVRTAQEAKKDALAGMGYLRQRQHSALPEGFDGEVGPVVVGVQGARENLLAQIAAWKIRPRWLLGFLGIMLVNLFLFRRWCRNTFGKESV